MLFMRFHRWAEKHAFVAMVAIMTFDCFGSHNLGRGCQSGSLLSIRHELIRATPDCNAATGQFDLARGYGVEHQNLVD